MSKIVSPLKGIVRNSGLEPSRMPYSIYYIMYRAFIISLFSKTVHQEASGEVKQTICQTLTLTVSNN